MAKKSKSAAASPTSKSQTPAHKLQEENSLSQEAVHSLHVPPHAQLLPPGTVSQKPLLKLARERQVSSSRSCQSSKELWLIQVPRTVSQTDESLAR